MKRIIVLCVFLLLSVYMFAEVQIELSEGILIRTDNYSETQRTLYGVDFNPIFRVMPSKYIGVFGGFNLTAIVGADNGDYLDSFSAVGMNATVDSDAGIGIGGRFGLSLSYPFNDKFSLSSDIGISISYLYEGIEGHINYQGSTLDEIILLEAQNLGILASIFGSFRFTERVMLTFGVKSEYIVSRKEKAKATISGYGEIKDDDFVEVDDYLGISIIPFAGLAFTF